MLAAGAFEADQSLDLLTALAAAGSRTSSATFWGLLELVTLGACWYGFSQLREARTDPRRRNDVSRIQTYLVVLVGWALIVAVRLLTQTYS